LSILKNKNPIKIKFGPKIEEKKKQKLVIPLTFKKIIRCFFWLNFERLMVSIVEGELIIVFTIGLARLVHNAFLTHHRPAMPFGNRKIIFWRIFSAQYCHNSKNITPLET